MRKEKSASRIDWKIVGRKFRDRVFLFQALRVTSDLEGTPIPPPPPPFLIRQLYWLTHKHQIENHDRILANKPRRTIFTIMTPLTKMKDFILGTTNTRYNSLSLAIDNPNQDKLLRKMRPISIPIIIITLHYYKLLRLHETALFVTDS